MYLLFVWVKKKTIAQGAMNSKVAASLTLPLFPKINFSGLLAIARRFAALSEN